MGAHFNVADEPRLISGYVRLSALSPFPGKTGTTDNKSTQKH